MRPALLASLVALSCASDPGPIAALDRLKTPGGPGGALAVLAGDSLVWAEAFGLAELDGKRPITLETNFRLASVTKQFTAAAVLLLVDRGLLALDSPIGGCFAELPAASRDITVEQLLTHTSGILAYEDLISDTATVPVLDRDVLRLVAGADSTYFPPGTAYRYSNTGYALLALLVEEIAGESFAKFLEREIFGPLGMNRTVAFEAGRSTVFDRAYGHSPAPEEGFVQTDQSMTSSVLGDGGIYSSVTDLRRWIDALDRGAVLAPETMAMATTPHAAIDDTGRWYGMGWYIRAVGQDTVVYHGGSTVGFRTCILRVPRSRSAVIALFNRSDADAEGIATSLARRFGLLDAP